MKKNILLVIGLLFCGNLSAETLTYDEYIVQRKRFCCRGVSRQSDKCFFYSFYDVSTGTCSITYAFYDELPSCLSKDKKNLFLPYVEEFSNGSRKIYIMFYGDLPKYDQEKVFFRKKRISKSRKFDVSQFPEKLNNDQLARFLKENSVLFFTGEGMSKFSDFDNVFGSFGIDKKTLFQNPEFYCQTIVENRKEIRDAFKLFYSRALNAIPTDAHLALATIAKKLGSLVYTSNLDILHEQTGIRAYRFWVPGGKEKMTPSLLNKLNAVVCIGMDYDSSGFLARYKEENPSGKIVAIGSVQPSYLGNEDFFVKGDIQEILPKIANIFENY